MKYKNTIIAFAFLTILLSCNKDDASKTAASLNDNFKFDKNDVTIGTFNLEWLGDGYDDRKERTAKDYQNYAKIIMDLGVDIIGVQEVENFNALKKIVDYLPDYSFYVGNEGGAQKIGLIYRKKINIKSLGEYTPVMIQEGRTKPGLYFSVKVSNFDFLLMVVHLKSSSHFDNTPEKIQNSFGVRELQAETLARWSDSVLNKGEEKDLIIVGDFNDSPRRKKDNTLYPLNKMIFISGDQKSCRFPSAYTIDQIVISPEAAKRYLPNSIFMYNIISAFTKAEAKNLSDHCPVIAKFDVKKADNDPPKTVARK